MPPIVFPMSAGGAINGVVPEGTLTHQMTVPSVAGQQGYLIPVWDWFKNAATECILERNTGGGFVKLTFGVDFNGFVRSGAPASVVDAVIGFYLAAAPPAGQTFRFTWFERIIYKIPMGIAKAKLTGGGGGTPDMTVKWSQNTSNAPNGVTVPELTGYLVEFWRKNVKSGGLHTGPLGAVQRRGPRYIPYYRGPAAQFNFQSDEFSPNIRQKRWHYRVCYYNPVSFARSILSTDIIVVNSTPKADFVGQPGDPQVRQARSVWIE